ncbi:O-methyltransferase [Stenotrophomonas maltophilia]|uniref:O-methyltransferase n=2 Tax=Stenotrophomonas maltophilia TaxID=40324 RepID=UPI0013DD82CB|nr:O-methyltransferase [Stenotrophomonas maltophilia]
MSPAPSFERFDYLLRTNKHIERRIVFDVIASSRQKLGVIGGWYLGFGSMWFGDFRIAHRQLRIDDLVSIEHEDYAKRAEFNRPFAGVRVKSGSSEDVLPRISPEEWNSPVIAWLDYDGYLNSAVVSDVDLILDAAAVNSVVIITVNADRRTYRPRSSSGPREREETAVGVVEGFLGRNVTPPKYEPCENEVGVYQEPPESVFPEYLCEAVISYMAHRVAASGRTAPDGQVISFTPLFKLHHKDGADMVTIGGAITTEHTANSWSASVAEMSVISDEGGFPSYCKLDLIPFTVKEKIILDECLPGESDGDMLEGARKLGIQLAEKNITDYRKFYRYFPVFVESGI